MHNIMAVILNTMSIILNTIAVRSGVTTLQLDFKKNETESGTQQNYRLYNGSYT